MKYPVRPDGHRDGPPLWKRGIMKISLLFLILGLLFLVGCAGPEGGSSLPWSQPETWEHDIGIGEEF